MRGITFCGFALLSLFALLQTVPEAQGERNQKGKCKQWEPCYITASRVCKKQAEQSGGKFNPEERAEAISVCIENRLNKCLNSKEKESRLANTILNGIADGITSRIDGRRDATLQTINADKLQENIKSIHETLHKLAQSNGPVELTEEDINNLKVVDKVVEAVDGAYDGLQAGLAKIVNGGASVFAGALSRTLGTLGFINPQVYKEQIERNVADIVDGIINGIETEKLENLKNVLTDIITNGNSQYTLVPNEKSSLNQLANTVASASGAIDSLVNGASSSIQEVYSGLNGALGTLGKNEASDARTLINGAFNQRIEAVNGLLDLAGSLVGESRKKRDTDELTPAEVEHLTRLAGLVAGTISTGANIAGGAIQNGVDKATNSIENTIDKLNGMMPGKRSIGSYFGYEEVPASRGIVDGLVGGVVGGLGEAVTGVGLGLAAVGTVLGKRSLSEADKNKLFEQYLEFEKQVNLDDVATNIKNGISGLTDKLPSLGTRGLSTFAVDNINSLMGNSIPAVMVKRAVKEAYKSMSNAFTVGSLSKEQKREVFDFATMMLAGPLEEFHDGVESFGKSLVEISERSIMTPDERQELVDTLSGMLSELLGQIDEHLGDFGFAFQEVRKRSLTDSDKIEIVGLVGTALNELVEKADEVLGEVGQALLNDANSKLDELAKVGMQYLHQIDQYYVSIAEYAKKFQDVSSGVAKRSISWENQEQLLRSALGHVMDVLDELNELTQVARRDFTDEEKAAVVSKIVNAADRASDGAISSVAGVAIEIASAAASAQKALGQIDIEKHAEDLVQAFSNGVDATVVEISADMNTVTEFVSALLGVDLKTLTPSEVEATLNAWAEQLLEYLGKGNNKEQSQLVRREEERKVEIANLIQPDIQNCLETFDKKKQGKELNECIQEAVEKQCPSSR